ncbi:MOSC domain-containing protein [Flavobacterium undicola]|uniref:MOSC domain-containing protein n=1 Tax=Flavobacterium undicola TaxID=1932779 RepID=UPI00137875F6|nr:MOSC domain-containing protein [Flavobacterium undicola]MBA0882878.1 MOSC domain-containing protein [Flavobacterium undicola]
MLQLSEIWIYPVKSLAGIRLEESRVTQRGLEYDRRWMLVDEEGVFISQRTHPKLALFQPKIEKDIFHISHADLSKGSVSFSLSQQNNNALSDVMVWEDCVAAVEVDAEISAWFSEILGFSVRLVYMPDESQRKVDPDFAISPTDITSFSDGFPFLIIGQSSLDDLNSRLAENLSIRRFRPNFVFSGGQAYEEESWKEFTIGTLLFYGVKPCGRCIMTTVNPEKGVFSGKDPLFTLSKYKKVGEKVIFGQNAIAKQDGNLKVSDVVTVVKHSDSK